MASALDAIHLRNKMKYSTIPAQTKDKFKRNELCVRWRLIVAIHWHPHRQLFGINVTRLLFFCISNLFFFFSNNRFAGIRRFHSWPMSFSWRKLGQLLLFPG